MTQAEFVAALKTAFGLKEPCTNGTHVVLTADCVDGVWVFNAEVTHGGVKHSAPACSVPPSIP